MGNIRFLIVFSQVQDSQSCVISSVLDALILSLIQSSSGGSSSIVFKLQLFSNSPRPQPQVASCCNFWESFLRGSETDCCVFNHAPTNSSDNRAKEQTEELGEKPNNKKAIRQQICVHTENIYKTIFIMRNGRFRISFSLIIKCEILLLITQPTRASHHDKRVVMSIRGAKNCPTNTIFFRCRIDFFFLCFFSFPFFLLHLI